MKDGYWLFQKVCTEGWLLAVSERVCAMKDGCSDGCWLFQSVCNEGRLLAVSERVCAMRDGCWLFQKEWLWDTTRCWSGWPEHVSFYPNSQLHIVPPLLQRKARIIKGSFFETLE